MEPMDNLPQDPEAKKLAEQILLLIANSPAHDCDDTIDEALGLVMEFYGIL